MCLMVSSSHSSSLKTCLSQAIREHLRPYLASLKDTTLKGNLYALVLEQVEKPLLEEVMALTKGNQSLAAEVLGINRNTLRKKLKDLNLL